MLTQEKLKKLLRYDASSGVFYWEKTISNRAVAGSVAGYIDGHGYIAIGIGRKLHRAHRLAWLYVFGTFPKADIDHINKDRKDNRIENLRLATRAQNLQNCFKKSNNTSGVTGVSWNKRTQKWEAHITSNYKKVFLGLFDSIEDATNARLSAKKKYHTFHSEDINTQLTRNGL
jgi:hypothetical protein